jgi:hypothetical protein
MRLTRLPVFVTFAAAGLSAALVGVGTWDKARAGLLTALSVIAAAALVRLARGLPFTNPDHFEPDEVEKVAAAVKQLARSLRVFLGVTLATMALLVLAQPLAHVVGRLWLTATAQDVLLRVLSGLVGGFLGYVVVRLWQIVGSDLSLLDKQAEFTIRAVHRKARKRDEERAEQEAIPPFKTPEGYGRRLQ